MKNCLLLLFVAILVTRCGKYAPPQPPEYFSPQGVNEITALADINGIVLKWEAPSKDRRGQQLKTIEGYYIKRRLIDQPSDILASDDTDILIATIEDTHLKVLQELREKAIEEGRISRKVTVDKQLSMFSYTDTDIEPGKTYLYSIIPFNQGKTEGLVPQKVKVNYRGDASVVTIVETGDLDRKNYTNTTSKKMFKF